MDPLTPNVVVAFLARTAAVLHWKVTQDDDYFHDEEATAPNGWVYKVQWGKHVPWMTTQIHKDPAQRFKFDFVTKDGVEQRGIAARSKLPSLEVAREAAERHYARSLIPKKSLPTDAAGLAAHMTQAQKALILEAFDNGGQVPPDWGTRSERSLRQLRTWLVKQLAPIGIFHELTMTLTPLGTEIAKLLKT